VRWGEQGLDALIEAALRTPRSKNNSLATEVLATLAAGERIPLAEAWLGDKELFRRISMTFPNEKHAGALVATRDDLEEQVVGGFASQLFQKGRREKLSRATKMVRAAGARWEEIRLEPLSRRDENGKGPGSSGWTRATADGTRYRNNSLPGGPRHYTRSDAEAHEALRIAIVLAVR
jgi:hypothetical protein